MLAFVMCAFGLFFSLLSPYSLILYPSPLLPFSISTHLPTTTTQRNYSPAIGILS